jgi:hypothetical protein
MYANATGGNLLYANTNVTLRSNTAGTTKDWIFGSDSTTTFPSNTIKQSTDTALSIVTSTLTTGIGVHLQTGGSGYPVGAFIAVPTTVFTEGVPQISTGTGLTVDIVVTEGGDPGIGYVTSVTLNSPGINYLPGDFLSVDTGDDNCIILITETQLLTPHTWNFDTDGKLTFPGAEGFQATFGSVEPVGDVLHSVNSLYLESELTVGLSSGTQVNDLETAYNDQLTNLTSLLSAELYGTSFLPASHDSIIALEAAKAINPLISDQIITVAIAVSDAWDAWQAALNASEVNISVAGSKTWTFGSDGKLTLPDGLPGTTSIINSGGFGSIGADGSSSIAWTDSDSNPTQISAITADGNTGVVIQAGAVAGGPPVPDYQWTFGTDGKLTLPGGGSIESPGGQVIRIRSSNTYNNPEGIERPFDTGVEIGNEGFAVYSRNDTTGPYPASAIFGYQMFDPTNPNFSIGLTPSTRDPELGPIGWTFRVDGSLAFPNASTFDGQILTDHATGTNYTLKIANGGVAGSVFGIGTGDATYGIANDALNHAEDGYVPYRITASQVNLTVPGANRTWGFGSDGELALPTNGYTEAVIKELDATALVLFAQKAGANIKLLAGATSAAGAKQWLFNGTDGKLTAPGNLQVDGGKIILNSAGNAYVESVDYGVNSANSAVNIFGGPYQKIKLRAGFGTGSTWTLGTDGSLTLPSAGKIVNNNKEWTFSTDGKLALPQGSTITDNRSFNNFTAGTNYTSANWGGDNISFNNVSISLQHELSLLESGDFISLTILSGTFSTTVADVYSGGPSGSLTVTRGRGDGDGITSITLLDRTASGIELTTHSNTWTFGQSGELSLPAGGDVINSTGVSQLANRVEGSWTVATGTATYSFTVPSDGTYTMWVKGNIPNGIITWNATLSITNSNVPAIGQQYAWNYTGGGTPISLTSIPDQIRGSSGVISTDATYTGTTSNRFDFDISNTSGATQTIYYGYTKV